MKYSNARAAKAQAPGQLLRHAHARGSQRRHSKRTAPANGPSKCRGTPPLEKLPTSRALPTRAVRTPPLPSPRIPQIFSFASSSARDSGDVSWRGVAAPWQSGNLREQQRYTVQTFREVASPALPCPLLARTGTGSTSQGVTQSPERVGWSPSPSPGPSLPPCLPELNGGQQSGPADRPGPDG